MDPTDTSKFRTKDLADANTDQLIGMSQMAVADGRVTQDEADVLQKFLVRASTNPSPIIINLLDRTNEFLADGVLDDDEAKELLELLQSIAGAPGELGEIAKPATLPLCEPAPTIVLQGSSFCFTGTFEFGNRKQCETATKDSGGSAGSLNQKTDYLVIGSYVTDAWKHETFGRKIEKAMGFRDKNGKPSIVSEDTWRKALAGRAGGADAPEADSSVTQTDEQSDESIEQRDLKEALIFFAPVLGAAVLIGTGMYFLGTDWLPWWGWLLVYLIVSFKLLADSIEEKD